MEPLSSFAISFAAGIVLELYKTINSSVKQEINSAFNETLKDWTKNETIRIRNENKFKQVLKTYIENPDSFKDNEFDNNSITRFYTYFNTRISEYQSAYNFLKDIKDEIRYNELKKEFSESKQILSEILENIHFDPRDIGERLDELPFYKGEKEVKRIILSHYESRLIDSNIKETLLLVVKKIYKRTRELEREIEYLKSSGNNELAVILEKIKRAVENRKPDNLSKIYDNFIKQEKKNKIRLLKELIESSLSIFAYKKSEIFYKDLVKLEPTSENHFNFAYFLQEYNFINDAINEYIEALKIYREFAKEKPRSYLLNVATTLNNLANLHSDKNEFPQALEKYEEALKIYRELAKENPRKYLPDVAATLNNLANLQKAKTEFPQALEKYEEALKIRRELAKENPQTYLPDVATTLNNFGVLLKKKNEVPQALEKYEEALKIRKEFAKENPQTYLPDVATTLNNLAVLYSAKNEFPQALEKHEEALKIGRELAKKNPRVYEIDYAQMLIMGVDLFKKNKKVLKEASKILNKYSDVYQARRLMGEILRLE